MKTDTIPITEVDKGISTILYNSVELLKTCKIIFYDKIKYSGGISVPTTQKYEDYCTVLYYYALEEFGKALKLKNAKDESNKLKTSNIHVGEWWLSHDEKIKTVFEIFGDELNIKKSEEIPPVDLDVKDFHPKPDGKIPAYDKMKNLRFHTITYKDPIFTNYQWDRANLLLTDYDDKTKKWGTHVPRFTHHEIEIKIPKLLEIIQNWEEELNLSV